MALINLRNALMAGKRLPYDAELEYIRGTGTQYINSGLTVSNALRVKCRVSIEGVCWIFGGRTGGNNKQFSVYQQASTNIRWGYANASVDKTNSYGAHDIDFNQNAVYFDGALLHTFAASTFSSPSPLYIGTSSIYENGTPASQCLIGNIYAFQVYVDGILVRDYIPVRKGNVGYLYDRVSGKLFGNAGTGDFVLGPYVVPVEWLQSTTGTEHIDTGVLPSADLRTKIRASYMYNPILKNSSLFGSRTTASSNDRYWINYDGHIEIGYGNYVATSLKLSTGELVDIDFNYIENGEHRFKVNDLVTTASGNPNTTVGIILFGRITGTTLTRCTARFYYADFIRNGVDVGKFRPVRVETEGAMMDVLTRRIYRNAGSGAFSYGNDLKYPIPAA